MAVLIESCEKTKSGKAWRVKASGKYYNAFLDSGIEQHVGKLIEAEIHTHEKFGSSIAAFRVVKNAAPQVPPPTQATSPVPAAAAPVQGRHETREPVYAEPAKHGTVAPYWLPFASNTVNAAIAAGLIKSPNEISMWVRGAQLAAIASVDAGDAPF